MPAPIQDASWLIRSLRPEMSHPVGDAGLGALAFVLERRVFRSGQLLYREETTPDGVWAIRAGSVELSRRIGHRRSVVQILREGDVAGDVAILLGSVSLTTARVRDAGTFLFLRADRARSVLSTHADLSYLWMQNVAFRLEGARRRILELVGDDLAQSLARLIINEEVDGHVALPQAALAEMLGVQRSSVNRVLQSLRQSGIVDLSYGAVTIKDRDALEGIALITDRRSQEAGLTLG